MIFNLLAQSLILSADLIDYDSLLLCVDLVNVYFIPVTKPTPG